MGLLKHLGWSWHCTLFFLKKGSGPDWGDSSVSKDNGPNRKRCEPQRKYCGHSSKPAVSPRALLLSSNPDHSEHNWLPVSSMLGSKHQITKILWARRAQDSQWDRLYWLLGSTAEPSCLSRTYSQQACKAGSYPPWRLAPESQEPFIR